MWPNNNSTTQEVSYAEQIIFANNNEEALNWSQQVCFKEDGKNIAKVVGRRPKKGSSVPLIKGQWTDEEDRLSNHEIIKHFFFMYIHLHICFI